MYQVRTEATADPMRIDEWRRFQIGITINNVKTNSEKWEGRLKTWHVCLVRFKRTTAAPREWRARAVPEESSATREKSARPGPVGKRVRTERTARNTRSRTGSVERETLGPRRIPSSPVVVVVVVVGGRRARLSLKIARTDTRHRSVYERRASLSRHLHTPRFGGVVSRESVRISPSSADRKAHVSLRPTERIANAAKFVKRRLCNSLAV